MRWGIGVRASCLVIRVAAGMENPVVDKNMGIVNRLVSTSSMAPGWFFSSPAHASIDWARLFGIKNQHCSTIPGGH